MSGYLGDTCAISEFQKASPDIGVLAWFARIDLSVLFLSAVTIGELRYGVALLGDRKKRVALETWLVSEVLPNFEGRIIPFDADGADCWGQLGARAKVAGKRIPVIDA